MKGFKTVVYGLAIAATAVLADANVKAFVNEHFASVGGLLGTGVILLRALTSSPIFTKSEDEG